MTERILTGIDLIDRHWSGLNPKNPLYIRSLQVKASELLLLDGAARKVFALEHPCIIVSSSASTVQIYLNFLLAWKKIALTQALKSPEKFERDRALIEKKEVWFFGNDSNALAAECKYALRSNCNGLLILLEADKLDINEKNFLVEEAVRNGWIAMIETNDSAAGHRLSLTPHVSTRNLFEVALSGPEFPTETLWATLDFNRKRIYAADLSRELSR